MTNATFGPANLRPFLYFGIYESLSFLPLELIVGKFGAVASFAVMAVFVIAVIHLNGLGFNLKIKSFGKRTWLLLRLIVLCAVLSRIGMTLFPSNPQDRMVQAYGLPAFILFAVVIGPAIEELCFRQMLYRFLETRENSPRSIMLVSSLLFSLSHLTYLYYFGASLFVFALIIATFFIGIIFFKIRLDTQSVTACIGAHIIYNGLLALRYF